MSKFNFHMREMGSVAIFDLYGNPIAQDHDDVQDVAVRIQKNIRRHRFQRVLLNMKNVAAMDEVGVRKILASCIRPKQSIIYGAQNYLILMINENHLSKNIGICCSEKEVAEMLGPFLFNKDESKVVLKDVNSLSANSKNPIERRRSHRMHVALPLEIKILNVEQLMIVTTAIATNISEGGLFAEYLDLEAAEKIEEANVVVGSKAQIHIFPSANFKEEFDVMAIVRHKDVRGKQLGLGFEFIE